MKENNKILAWLMAGVLMVSSLGTTFTAKAYESGMEGTAKLENLETTSGTAVDISEAASGTATDVSAATSGTAVGNSETTSGTSIDVSEGTSGAAVESPEDAGEAASGMPQKYKHLVKVPIGGAVSCKQVFGKKYNIASIKIPDKYKKCLKADISKGKIYAKRLCSDKINVKYKINGKIFKIKVQLYVPKLNYKASYNKKTKKITIVLNDKQDIKNIYIRFKNKRWNSKKTNLADLRSTAKGKRIIVDFSVVKGKVVIKKMELTLGIKDIKTKKIRYGKPSTTTIK